MKRIVPFFLLLLTGCATAPLGNNKADFDNAKRIDLRQAAEKGDKSSQYALGNAYCCGDTGYWDTKEALKWWCKASMQGVKEADSAIARVDGACPKP